MRQKRRLQNGCEVISNIVTIRAIEDSIRASGEYSEGIGTMRRKHPIQGEGFPSQVFCKYYEVYPGVKINWDMPVGVAVEWLTGVHRFIGVVFKYDYRVNKASVMVKDGKEGVDKLFDSIPNFGDAWNRAIVNGNGKS